MEKKKKRGFKKKKQGVWLIIHKRVEEKHNHRTEETIFNTRHIDNSGEKIACSRVMDEEK